MHLVTNKKKNEMAKFTVLPLCVIAFLLFLCTESWAKSEEWDENDAVAPSCCGFSSPLLIKKDQWKPIFATKFGQISTVQIGDGCGGMGPYNIHSITLKPNALLLPLLLHSDMVFFVDSGSGILNWVEEKAMSSEIRRGDVYRIRPGSVFYLQSKPVNIFLGTKLRVYAIFSNTEECLHDPCFGAYSSITDLLFGFDETILQSAFGVPEEIIGLMRNRTKPPLIVDESTPGVANTLELQPRLLRLFGGDESGDSLMEQAENKKKKPKKAKTFNVFESEPDFESPNGRTITINTKDLKALKGSRVGVFMANLTQGSMMAPHWNPWACEISIALKGAGMVRVLRSSISGSSSVCENVRFKVEEGDIFAVPRLHPMAQMSFNNDSFVFIGFTTSAKNNEPQFLAGKSSVLRMLDRKVLAASFNVSSVLIDGLLEAQNKEAVVLGCPSCAEGERMKQVEEEEKKKPQPRPEPQPSPHPQPPPQPFQPFPPPQEEPQESESQRETKRREDERKREEEEAKKEAEERRKREEEERWPPQPPAK